MIITITKINMIFITINF